MSALPLDAAVALQGAGRAGGDQYAQSGIQHFIVSARRQTTLHVQVRCGQERERRACEGMLPQDAVPLATHIRSVAVR